MRHRQRDRRASALLLILFLMAISAPLACLLLESHTTEIRCIHNHIGVRSALYAAEAGVHRAIGELLLYPSWRAGFTNVRVPGSPGHTYTVTLADTAENNIEITSIGRTTDGYSKTVITRVNGF